MEHLPTIYAAAVLLPLASFFAILIFANQMGRFAAWVATGAILLAGVLSFLAFGLWLNHHFPKALHHEHAAAHEEPGHHESGAEHGAHGSASHETKEKTGSLRGNLAMTMVALVQEPGAKTSTEQQTQPPTTATAKEPDAPHGEKIEVEHPVYSGEYYTLGV